jgi:hypothetical protein
MGPASSEATHFKHLPSLIFTGWQLVLALPLTLAALQE